jgi:hypothetical protein
MSPAPVLIRTGSLADTYRVDQRSHRRYPIGLNLEYKLLKRGRVGCSGFGKVLNISSRGVLFEAHEDLRAIGRIEVTIPWPFQLDGVCPLKLVMRGRIVRSDGNKIAIISEHHEFRTSGARKIGA